MRIACLMICWVACIGTALACLWDTDTIKTELKGVPDREVLVSNRWHRHGTSYYEERIARLASKPGRTLDEYDDLAVAYEKTKAYELALRVLREKRSVLEEHPDPDHLYRYHANYGTILAHSGKYEEALGQLEKAVEINPEAHFGREEYQILLIRYVIAARGDPTLWEKHNFLSYSGRSWPASHKLKSSYTGTAKEGDAASEEELERAYQGVAGMLRFGGREGPELYRALGDISLAQEHLNVAWYFYQMAILKEHPASERIEQAVQEIEGYWETSHLLWRPDREHFSAGLSKLPRVVGGVPGGRAARTQSRQGRQYNRGFEGTDRGG